MMKSIMAYDLPDTDLFLLKLYLSAAGRALGPFERSLVLTHLAVGDQLSAQNRRLRQHWCSTLNSIECKGPAPYLTNNASRNQPAAQLTIPSFSTTSIAHSLQTKLFPFSSHLSQREAQLHSAHKCYCSYRCVPICTFGASYQIFKAMWKLSISIISLTKKEIYSFSKVPESFGPEHFDEDPSII